MHARRNGTKCLPRQPTHNTAYVLSVAEAIASICHSYALPSLSWEWNGHRYCIYVSDYSYQIPHDSHNALSHFLVCFLCLVVRQRWRFIFLLLGNFVKAHSPFSIFPISLSRYQRAFLRSSSSFSGFFFPARAMYLMLLPKLNPSPLSSMKSMTSILP